jgi:glycosyltransferase involved in cell wall biosynthesis
LQKRYPFNSEAIAINASNVEIIPASKEVLVNRINIIRKKETDEKVKIGLIGSYSSKYKGIDTAIKSLKTLIEDGIDCELLILGEGNNDWLIELSRKLDIEKKVFYQGSLPNGKKVFKWLDNLDIYIQPSLTEGLPRSVIEAMSRGLPCVASSVGGIPELIDKELIHKPKSDVDLSYKIELLLKNKKFMIEQAKKNYANSKKYTSEVLNSRRRNFWNHFIDKELTKK